MIHKCGSISPQKVWCSLVTLEQVVGLSGAGPSPLNALTTLVRSRAEYRVNWENTCLSTSKLPARTPETFSWFLPPTKPTSIAVRNNNCQGSDHASTQDVVDILVQLGGPRPRVPGPRNEDNGGDDVGNDPSTSPAPAIQQEGEVQSMGENGGEVGDNEAPQLSSQDSGASLLSQFPKIVGQEMPRAAMQSPIPLPPSGESERVQPEVDDAMRMSPPTSAG